MSSDRLPDRSLTDLASLRVLAHPIRLALLDLLRQHAQLTASQCSELLGHSPKTCSYHLHALGRQGFLEEVGVSGRKRFWRRTYDHANWTEPDERSPELAAAVVAVQLAQARRTQDLLERSLSTAAEDPADWRKARTASNWTVQLTADQLQEWSDEVTRITDRFARQGAETPRRDVRAVRLAVFGFPTELNQGAPQ